MRIVFMGTPDFAVPSLKKLHEEGYEISGVITAPDKPAGRGLQVKTPPVKDYAVKHNLPVYQPTNLKSSDFIDKIKSLNPDLQVVVAFRMLPQVLWQIPNKGTFNLHASLLPDYRGAAPIHWAIINGEQETGLTTFFIDQKIDTGDIILKEREPIYEEDTAGTLHDRMMEHGAELVLKTVKAIETGNYTIQQQNWQGDFKKAPKIQKEDCRINWDQTNEKVYNFIRGLSPFPAAYTYLNDKHCKITRVKKSNEELPGNKQPADFFTDNKNYLKIATQDGLISIEELQLEGKKKMPVKEFLIGTEVKSIE